MYWISLSISSATAANPPLDAQAIEALVEREGLSRQPHDGTCCNEGSVSLGQARWAELNGEAPPELVLTMLEYIGEGAATDHHYLYDVSDPAKPMQIGEPISSGGYMIFPYLQILDLDHDGRDELVLVGPTNEHTPSTLQVYRWEEGAMRSSPSVDSGLVVLPFDTDRDGTLELVGLTTEDVYDPHSPVDLRGFNASGLARPLPEPHKWMPRLFNDAVSTKELRRTDLTLRLLRQTLDQRDLRPADPEAALAAVIPRARANDPGAQAYIDVVSWAATPAQRRDLLAWLDTENSGTRLKAAQLLLQSEPGLEDRARVLDFAVRQTAASVRGAPPFDPSALAESLSDSERHALCGAIAIELLDSTLPEAPRGDLAWSVVGGPLFCTEVTTAILAAREPPPRQVLRAALHGIERAMESPAAAQRVRKASHLPEALVQELSNPNPGLRAEAARTLRHFNGTLQPLLNTLRTDTDGEVQRSVLVALGDLPEPGPAALFLELLERPGTEPRHTALHRELIRTGDTDAVRRGLGLARTPSAYGAYAWYAQHRTSTLSPEIRVVLAQDAAKRLVDKDKRTRQYACQVLSALPDLGHAEAMQRVATEDPISWVREACGAQIP